MNYDKVPELPESPAETARSRGPWLVGVGVLLVAVAAAWWQFGAKTPARAEVASPTSAQVAALDDRLVALRAQVTGLPENATPAMRRALLEEAVARQNEVMRLRSPSAEADGVRLAEWQAQLDDTVAGEQAAQSRELEAAADELLRAGQSQAAAEKLKEALRLQREINAGLSTRGAKSYGREARLQQQLEELTAKPLLEESQQALAGARAAAAGGSWADALRLYGRAREIQRQLNADFPRSKFSDLLADDRIATEMASLSASEAHAQREAFMQQAGAAAAAGKLAEADRFYVLAADRQQVINTQFAQSRFVSMELLERIDVERQTLGARPMLEALRSFDATAAAHLRRRELFQAQRQLAQARQQLEDAMRQFPKAKGFEEELCERLNYLVRRGADLVAIQDQAYDLLLPVPGGGPTALARTALPQALYVLVMNNNPSRKPGRALPVDSVNQAEAAECCRRLGWVLGATVRLPVAAELQAAGKAPGFETGRVEEWVGDQAAETTAAVFTRERTIRATDRGTRAATTGFRVVVAVDLLAPAR